MARRLSNKDRIARAAEEAKATAKQKAKTKKKESPSKPSTRKARSASPSGRMKIVWAVCDASRRVVRVYPYPEYDDAKKEAERLTESKGKEHIVRKDKVPMED